jgi:predicted dehydrogenase
MVVPRHVVGGPGYQAPSDTLNVAGVGVGSMGGNNLRAMKSENIVALCDVDWDYASETFSEFPSARRYRDFRVMLDENPEIDAVVVATPDHTHAMVAQKAMQMGKHVYVQKPLTTTVEEARVLRRLADETGVVTQMGNQGRSKASGQRINEIIREEIIGTVQEVHIWTNRPIWPQGIERPEKPGDLPDQLSWDLYLGPAKYRQYHSAYHPFAWRGWTDFGVGALGDMGAHLMDHAIWSMDLGYPTRVEAQASSYNGASFPAAMLAYYTFEREDEDDLLMNWYDGGLKPSLQRYLPRGVDAADVETVEGGMVMYVGEDGVLLHEVYGKNPVVFPTDLREDVRDLEKSLPRESESHEMSFVNACKGNGRVMSPFSEAGPVTETMLLGVAALEAGHPIEYDGDSGTITNSDAPNRFISRTYHGCWSLADV